MVPEDVVLELRSGPAAAGTGDLGGTLAAVERDVIARAVRDHHGNLAAAGRALGIERNLLYYKLRQYGLKS
jgi:DNA-binding NtrC family response regulator